MKLHLHLHRWTRWEIGFYPPDEFWSVRHCRICGKQQVRSVRSEDHRQYARLFLLIGLLACVTVISVWYIVSHNW